MRNEMSCILKYESGQSFKSLFACILTRHHWMEAEQKIEKCTEQH
uniref:Uncharacterized protein n=1 Tax=Arundo donax TaxID=35708 RepID=A0A0A8YRC1_ARUDO